MLRMEIGNGLVADHASRSRAAGRSVCRGVGQCAVSQAGAARARAARICRHDDGWAARDAHPVDHTRRASHRHFRSNSWASIRRLRRSILQTISRCAIVPCASLRTKDPYAGLLISMHTYNLLTAHADRSTIAPEGLSCSMHFSIASAHTRTNCERSDCERMLPWHSAQERSRRFWNIFACCRPATIFRC